MVKLSMLRALPFFFFGCLLQLFLAQDLWAPDPPSQLRGWSHNSAIYQELFNVVDAIQAAHPSGFYLSVGSRPAAVSALLENQAPERTSHLPFDLSAPLDENGRRAAFRELDSFLPAEEAMRGRPMVLVVAAGDGEQVQRLNELISEYQRVRGRQGSVKTVALGNLKDLAETQKRIGPSNFFGIEVSADGRNPTLAKGMESDSYDTYTKFAVHVPGESIASSETTNYAALRSRLAESQRADPKRERQMAIQYFNTTEGEAWQKLNRDLFRGEPLPQAILAALARAEARFGSNVPGDDAQQIWQRAKLEMAQVPTGVRIGQSPELLHSLSELAVLATGVSTSAEYFRVADDTRQRAKSPEEFLASFKEVATGAVRYFYGPSFRGEELDPRLQQEFRRWSAAWRDKFPNEPGLFQSLGLRMRDDGELSPMRAALLNSVSPKDRIELLRQEFLREKQAGRDTGRIEADIRLELKFRPELGDDYIRAGKQVPFFKRWMLDGKCVRDFANLVKRLKPNG